jgi:hypothetical protein
MVDHNQRMERTLCLWEVSIALHQRILFVKCCVSDTTLSIFVYSVYFRADLVLSNKLVVYDLENQVIGWTDYNCKC